MSKLIATDINGIIRELRIREEDFLLSFFELVVNSIQAIEEDSGCKRVICKMIISLTKNA